MPDGDKRKRRLGSKPPGMKIFFEIVLSVLLHPVAFLLMIINVVKRDDLTLLKKVLWLAVGWIWALGPLAYVFLGDGQLF